MNTGQLITSIEKYSKAMGPHCTLNCGNLLVAAQYLLPLRIISKYLSSSEKVLDWGCGMGHFSYLLMQEGFDVQSYSYSTEDDLEGVKKASKQILNQQWNLLSSQYSDPVKLPFTNDTYDAVVSLGVLEHVRETGGNEKGSLKEIYRLLKPGGYFFCFHFPNRYSWIEAVSRTLNHMHIKKFYHRYLYTKKDIHKLIGSTPFQLYEMKKYNLLPRRMLCKLPRKLGWNRGLLSTYRVAEKLLSFPLGTFSQNYYFVLQKNDSTQLS